MYNFSSDYLEGCHPSILKKLAETNLEQTSGYGEDPYCAEAAAEILTMLSKIEGISDVQFMMQDATTEM